VGFDDFDLGIDSGRIRVRRHGPSGAPLVLCVPGLSANLTTYDFIAERLADGRRQVVAVDLRGRGYSETTPPGTYGWARHAADLFAVADALGAARFSVIGHSMGAAVTKAAARQDAGRIERAVLLDHCGIPEAGALTVIGRSIARLGVVYPSAEAYLEQMRGLGAIRPWSEHWDRYFLYELEPCDGGVRSRTSPAAVFEDAAFGAGAYAFESDATVYRLWRHLTMPVLLLRAGQEITPGSGFIVSEDDGRRFAETVPSARVTTVDATHYSIATSDATVAEIAAFLDA
jgi:pimeloyl-ACP methyl ester carboxylesterase